MASKFPRDTATAGLKRDPVSGAVLVNLDDSVSFDREQTGRDVGTQGLLRDKDGAVIVKTTGLPLAVRDAVAGVPDSQDEGWDIILLAGQSNMVGIDTAVSVALKDPSHPRIYTVPSSGPNVGQVVWAVEPLAHPLGGSGVGPGMPTARWYVDSVVPGNRRALLVPCAESSTGFEASSGPRRWKVSHTPLSENIFEQAVSLGQNALALAGPGARVAGVLWLQGESDSMLPANAALYEANLDALIDGFRSRFATPDLPFVVVQMAAEFRATYGSAGADVVNAVHVDTPRRKSRTGFAYGSAIATLDGTHYTAPGQRENGMFAAGAFGRALRNVTGRGVPVIRSLSLVQSGDSLVVSWSPPPRVTGYTVEFRLSGVSGWTKVTRPATSIDARQAIGGLVKGSSYDVRVTGTNEDGTGAAVSGSLVTLTNPAQVAGVTAGTVTPSTIPVSWSPAARAASYLVEYKASASGTWLSAGSTTGTATTIVGLVASTSYDVRVTARNAAGDAPASVTAVISTAVIGFLLSDVPVSAARAYSTARKLRSGHSGSAFLARRSSDNAELAFGFDGAGNVDTAALVAWAGAGDAFVKTLYDQSGNGRDITQATVGRQPKIVAAGALVAQNLKVGTLFDGTDDFLGDSAPGAWAAGAATVMTVQRSSATSGRLVVEANGTTASRGSYVPVGQVSGQLNTAITDDALVAFVNKTSAKVLSDALHQVTNVDTGTTVSPWRDGALTAGDVVTYSRSGRTLTLDRFNVGSGLNGGTVQLPTAAHVAEVVVWYSALGATDRANGEANQRGYYSTPAP